ADETRDSSFSAQHANEDANRQGHAADENSERGRFAQHEDPERCESRGADEKLPVQIFGTLLNLAIPRLPARRVDDLVGDIEVRLAAELEVAAVPGRGNRAERHTIERRLERVVLRETGERRLVRFASRSGYRDDAAAGRTDADHEHGNAVRARRL